MPDDLLYTFLRKTILRHSTIDGCQGGAHSTSLNWRSTGSDFL
jgi:hypothetical protein